MNKDLKKSWSKEIDRRKFLKNSILGTAGAGLILSGGDKILAKDKRSLITRKLEQGETYKVGILGCGNRSKSHISSLNEVPEIEVAALCDLIPHKMKRRAELIRQGPEPAMYTDMEEMFRQEELDAVANVLPNHLHAQATIAALEAGKHVLLEKPMALTVADCAIKSSLLPGERERPCKSVHNGVIAVIIKCWSTRFAHHRLEKSCSRMLVRIGGTGGCRISMSILREWNTGDWIRKSVEALSTKWVLTLSTLTTGFSTANRSPSPVCKA